MKNPCTQAQLLIDVCDMSVLNDLKRALKLMRGIDNVKVIKPKSELSIALDEAKKGEVREWDSVDDYFKKIGAHNV